jgi:plastocyanin
MFKTLLAVLLLVTLAACGSDGSDASDEVAAEAVAGEATVVLKDMQFQPDVVTVDAGTTVTWVWDDGSVRHNVVADQFESEIQTEGTFTHTFEEPGEYPYVCTLHPNMTGTVIVLAGS